MTALPTDTDLNCFRGDTFTYSFTELDLSGSAIIYFTVKENYRDTDTQSILQISSASNLMILNATSASRSGSASAYIDVDSGKVTADIFVAANITDELEYNSSNYLYDLQLVKTNEQVQTLESGDFNLIRDVTRAIA